MRHMKNVVRIVLLLMVACAIGVLWMYGNTFLVHDLARGNSPLMLADRCAGFVTVFVLFAAPAIPIQALFPKYSVGAAVAVGWVPLAMGLVLAYHATDGVPSAYEVGFAAIEGCVEWGAIILGVSTVSRIRRCTP